MIWSFLLTCLTCVLAAAGMRYAGALGFAAPLPVVPAAWWTLAGASAVGACILTIRRWTRRTPISAKRAFVEIILVFPPFFAYEWAFLPPYHWRVLDWAVFAAFVAAVAAFMYRDRANFRQWGVTGRNFVPALKLLAVPTVLMIAAPIMLAFFVGTDFFDTAPSRLAAALLYPLYALAQLAVFQVFLVTRLRRLGGSTAGVVFVAAATFAILHWPNPVAMAACFIGASVWTWVYLRRANLFALAISMGLAAAAFICVLQDTFTHNMRTGPIYVQRLLDSK